MTNWILKNWPAALLPIAGIIACIATFFSSKSDSDQKDYIQELGEENKKLSEQKKNELNKQLNICQN